MNNKLWFPNKKELANLWITADFEEAEKELFSLQQKLAGAVITKDDTLVKECQLNILKSLSAKMLAVRHASSTSSGPGVDGVRLGRPYDKMQMALDLGADIKNYKAQPTRLLKVIPKRGKERNIKIPTMYDRALQILYSYTLSPIAQITGDKKSFGFKRNRSAMDAHHYVMKIFSDIINNDGTVEEAPKYVLLTDVAACYESISHKWLLKNIPMDKNVLKEFLKASHVFDGELFTPDTVGISLGSGLSPYLANMTLDGLQNEIYKQLYGYGAIDYGGGDMVRFADDILVSARTLNQAYGIKRIISKFLRVRGLSLSSTKTRIVKVEDGFDFLSRNYVSIEGYLFATPSEKAITNYVVELGEYINAYRGSQLSLIEELNRKLIGWASYHKYTDANDAFAYIDTVVDSFLLQLCKKKHPKAPLDYILGRYFIKDPDGNRLYALAHKQDVQVVRLSKTKLQTYKPINLNRNPYIDDSFSKELEREREIAHATGKYRIILNRQGGECHICGMPILPDQLKTIIAIDSTKPLGSKNSAYIHSRCVDIRVDYYKTSNYFASSQDIVALLNDISNKTVYLKSSLTFDALKEYLWGQSKASITMSFSQLEKMVGKLPTASANITWWHKQWAGSMRQVGFEAGYLPMRVNLKRRTVTFNRCSTSASTVRVPEVFLKGKVPVDAAAELESFFEYIRKKYGL